MDSTPQSDRLQPPANHAVTPGAPVTVGNTTDGSDSPTLTGTAVSTAPPPRPVWNCVAPSSGWCPEAWREHLEAVAPGLYAEGTSSTAEEAIGLHIAAAPWHLVLSSRRGRLHAHRGDHREDSGHVAAWPGGWCAAVADGAGSAAFSRLGSAIATAVASRVLRDALPDTDVSIDAVDQALRAAAQVVNERQREFAARAGLALRELRTTLLVAVRCGDWAGTMQVGDGAMALLHTDGSLSHPHAAATGDFSGEVAHFLPDDGALEVLQASVRVVPMHGVCAVLLASDGVEDPWYPFTRYARPLLHTLAHGHLATAADALPAALVPARQESVLQAPDPVSALSDWLAFEKRGENDDRTLCLAFTDALATVRADATRD